MSSSIFNFEYWHALRQAIAGKRRRLLFLALTLILCVCFAFFSLRRIFFFENFQVLAVKELSEKTKYLGIGSSRMFFGIDPKFMPDHYVSLAANYLDMAGAERVWAKHRGRVPNLETVLLEYGVSTLYYDMYTLSPQALQ